MATTTVAAQLLLSSLLILKGTDVMDSGLDVFFYLLRVHCDIQSDEPYQNPEC